MRLPRLTPRVVLLSCVVSSLAGIWAAEASSSPSALPTKQNARWADYPRAELIPSLDAFQLDGHTREIAHFFTRDAPSSVVNFFVTRWATTGFSIEEYDLEGEVWASGRDDVQERTVAAFRNGSGTAVVMSRRFLEKQSYTIDEEIESECEPLHHTSSDTRGVRRELLTQRCAIEAATLLDRYRARWGEPTDLLVDGRRYLARFSSMKTDRSIAIYSDSTAGEPVSFATIRTERNR